MGRYIGADLTTSTTVPKRKVALVFKDPDALAQRRNDLAFGFDLALKVADRRHQGHLALNPFVIVHL